jgi:regulator of protease activity HflC (stomatin/prohibitin superfamily)
MAFLKFIPTMTTGVVQTFGRFSRLAKPGLNWYIPIAQTITPVSNSLQEHKVPLNVRTQDKVFPDMDIHIQYRIQHENTEKALFKYMDPLGQMSTRTGNVVRQKVSRMSLDDIYESQVEIENGVLTEVGPWMEEGGITLESVQVLDIVPPRDVLAAMNEINASQRRMVAAKNDGEAHKIKEILQAEADARRKELQGEGIAGMRDNIISGWTESIKRMSDEWGTTPRETMEFVLRSLNFETMENMSKNDNTKVIFYDKMAGNVEESVRNGMIQANETK